MRTRWRNLAVALGLLLVSATAARAADDEAEARGHRDRAVAAYAQHQYADSAREYAQAYALKGDPVLLYDAAQSSRLAGEKQQALVLYREYLRRFRHQIGNRREVLRHIARLRQALAADRRVREDQPVAVAPVLSLPPGEPVLPTPPPAAADAAAAAPARPAAAAAAAAAPAAPASESATLGDAPGAGAAASDSARPPAAPVELAPPVPAEPARADLTTTAPAKTGRPWLLPVVITGAVLVAAAVTVGVVLGTRGGGDPTPSFGTAKLQ